MKTVKLITQRGWGFLKTAYANPMADLIDHPGFVREGEPFIQFDGKNWRLFRMGPDRIHLPRGRHKSLNAAIVAALQ